MLIVLLVTEKSVMICALSTEGVIDGI